MTTARDICTQALQECGYLGTGQTPDAEAMNGAFMRLNQMIAQWAKKRWLVYRLVTASWVATGAQTFTLGPTGDVSTTTDTVPLAISPRPERLETGNFVRLVNLSVANQPDVPLELLESKEDYNRISMKMLSSFPNKIFYDPTAGNGTVYPWPVPQASLYSVFVLFKLPFAAFASLDVVLTFPAEYEAAMMYSLAWRLRSRYNIPSLPGDPLLGLVNDALQTVRGSNTAIARLKMPSTLVRPSLYNIYSDQSY